MTAIEILEANKHIPDDEVRNDIRETLAEIEILKIEVKHLENTPRLLPDYRINFMKASAKRVGIENREQFVAKLRTLLNARGVTE